MKNMHPSPAFVVSLIALFVALGGTSYAAITSLPNNSVGTAQIKNGAVTAAKLNPAVRKSYLSYGSTLPSGQTETGVWGGGGRIDNDLGGGAAYPVTSFVVPLATAIDANHTIFVSGASATHCPGLGHAGRGYLCVYAGDLYGATTPTSDNIFNPDTGTVGAATRGFGIVATTNGSEYWVAAGSYAVTAP